MDSPRTTTKHRTPKLALGLALMMAILWWPMCALQLLLPMGTDACSDDRCETFNRWHPLIFLIAALGMPSGAIVGLRIARRRLLRARLIGPLVIVAPLVVVLLGSVLLVRTLPYYE